MPLDDFILVSSIDNYIELVYLKQGIVDKKIFRYSLSKIMQDNADIAEVFRCHKSYIVNKAQIESVSGNTAGYKLKLKGFDRLIPVSRQWNQSIKNMNFDF
jgi:DNA-binding LytR/AlgR family response regulator